MPLSVEQICEIIPHRYPFLLIDRVTEFCDGECIVGYKNVSANEPFFNGHFPGRPIMPGLLIIEAIAQLGCVYTKLIKGGSEPDSLMVLTGADGARFRRPVVPGDQLKLEVKEFRRKRNHWKISGTATVEGELACAATVTASEIKAGS
ncbi:3-hydroxyacyl-[acyl-carrier-protein] dehydratase FabZ [bacterium J17]|nr:3-hydroxyacyl-[acyl-carrier-protein] dehydratase FabZ [bacterium J17]